MRQFILDKLDGLGEALLRPVNTAAIIILGFYTTLWGLWVANPFWHVFTTAKLYSALVAFAPDALVRIGFTPEIFWGSIAIICGIIITRGAFKRSYRALVTGASVAFFHWLTIGGFYFLGDWQNTGGITALVFAIYAGFIYLNIKVNHTARGKNMTDMFT